jgi:CRISPR type III-A-associated protein Csm2
MGKRQCKECGEWFTPKESHHRTCDKCYSKGRKAPDNRRAHEKRGAGQEEADWTTGYLASGYLDDNGNVLPDLVTKIPEQIAISLGVGGVTSSQLRRFFNKARLIEQRLDANESFPSLIGEILELKQHAANAFGKAQKQDEKVGLERLKTFIDRNVEEAVKSQEAFRKGFLLHFQGVIAYFKYHNPTKK